MSKSVFGLKVSTSIVVLFLPLLIKAEIITDGSVGVKTNVAGPDYVVTQELGTLAGKNLFHSFEAFNLNVGESATFSGDNSISNIISRVTGSSVSNIDGSLNSTISGANFYFINPNGVFFGENSSININGSFYASTSHYLTFSDDESSSFSTDLNINSSFSASAPASFGFLDQPIGDITYSHNGFRILNVPVGETIALAGGNIKIGSDTATGFIYAPEGNIDLVSVAGEGVVNIENGRLSVSEGASLGDISLTGQSILDAKNIRLQGRDILIENSVLAPGGLSLIVAGTKKDGSTFSLPAAFGLTDSFADGGLIEIESNNSLSINGSGFIFGTFRSGIYSHSNYDYKSGGSLSVSNINIKSKDIVVEGEATILVERFGSGNAGEININAESMKILNGSVVGSKNFATGDGTNISINSNELLLSAPDTENPTGIRGDSVNEVNNKILTGLGNGGNIDITVNQLEISHGAVIATGASFLGNAGNIDITASDIKLSTDGALTKSGESSGEIRSVSSLAGNSGNISITTDTLTLSDKFQIVSTTDGAGNAGNIVIKITDSGEISGDVTGIFSNSELPKQADLDKLANALLGADYETLQNFLMFRFGLESKPDLYTVLDIFVQIGALQLDKTDVGNGGTIKLTANKLVLTDGAKIGTSTLTDGDAGSIELNVAELDVQNGALIRSLSGGVDADQNLLVGGGNAGNVSIESETLTIDGISEDGKASALLTQTRGDGTGGEINLNISENLTVSNGAKIGSDTGGNGNAGIIAINSKNININSGASVSSNSGITVTGLDLLGTGDGGIVNLQAEEIITLSGEGSIISTDTQGEGDGGNVNLFAKDIVLEDGSVVSSKSTGDGLAGNVTISAKESFANLAATVSTATVTSDGGDIYIGAGDDLRIEEGSVTTAVANGSGQGGNITLAVTDQAGNFSLGSNKPSPESQIASEEDFAFIRDSRIEANAFGGPGGNIYIVAGQFLSTTDNVIDASSQKNIDGTVDVQAPELDLNGGIAQLPDEFVDASLFLGSHCDDAQRGSSLIASEAGGAASDPDGYMASFASDFLDNDTSNNVASISTRHLVRVALNDIDNQHTCVN